MQSLQKILRRAYFFPIYDCLGGEKHKKQFETNNAKKMDVYQCLAGREDSGKTMSTNQYIRTIKNTLKMQSKDPKDVLPGQLAKKMSKAENEKRPNEWEW